MTRVTKAMLRSKLNEHRGEGSLPIQLRSKFDTSFVSGLSPFCTRIEFGRENRSC